MKIVDLTHVMNVHTPGWVGYAGNKMYYAQNLQTVRIVAQRIDTALHVGTHFDGAMHATDNRKGDMAHLPLDYLMNRGVVVDISKHMHDWAVITPEMIESTGADIRVLRDPTRGGLATTLNEIARQSGVGMVIDEARIPVNKTVAAACEFLGLDPLYVANEGKLLAIVAPEDAETLLTALRAHPLGQQAAMIGTVHEDAQHFVQMTTGFGGRRIVDWLTGEQLPRIC